MSEKRKAELDEEPMQAEVQNPLFSSSEEDSDNDIFNSLATADSKNQPDEKPDDNNKDDIVHRSRSSGLEYVPFKPGPSNLSHTQFRLNSSKEIFFRDSPSSSFRDDFSYGFTSKADEGRRIEYHNLPPTHSFPNNRNQSFADSSATMDVSQAAEPKMEYAGQLMDPMNSAIIEESRMFDDQQDPTDKRIAELSDSSLSIQTSPVLPRPDAHFQSRQPKINDFLLSFSQRKVKKIATEKQKSQLPSTIKPTSADTSKLAIASNFDCNSQDNALNNGIPKSGSIQFHPVDRSTNDVSNQDSSHCAAGSDSGAADPLVLMLFKSISNMKSADADMVEEELAEALGPDWRLGVGSLRPSETKRDWDRFKEIENRIDNLFQRYDSPSNFLQDGRSSVDNASNDDKMEMEAGSCGQSSYSAQTNPIRTIEDRNVPQAKEFVDDDSVSNMKIENASSDWRQGSIELSCEKHDASQERTTEIGEESMTYGGVIMSRDNDVGLRNENKQDFADSMDTAGISVTAEPVDVNEENLAQQRNQDHIETLQGFNSSFENNLKRENPEVFELIESIDNCDDAKRELTQRVGTDWRLRIELLQPSKNERDRKRLIKLKNRVKTIASSSRCSMNQSIISEQNSDVPKVESNLQVKTEGIKNSDHSKPTGDDKLLPPLSKNTVEKKSDFVKRKGKSGKNKLRPAVVDADTDDSRSSMLSDDSNHSARTRMVEKHVGKHNDGQKTEAAFHMDAFLAEGTSMTPKPLTPVAVSEPVQITPGHSYTNLETVETSDSLFIAQKAMVDENPDVHSDESDNDPSLKSGHNSNNNVKTSELVPVALEPPAKPITRPVAPRRKRPFQPQTPAAPTPVPAILPSNTAKKPDAFKRPAPAVKPSVETGVNKKPRLPPGITIIKSPVTSCSADSAPVNHGHQQPGQISLPRGLTVTTSRPEPIDSPSQPSPRLLNLPRGLTISPCWTETPVDRSNLPKNLPRGITVTTTRPESQTKVSPDRKSALPGQTWGQPQTPAPFRRPASSLQKKNGTAKMTSPASVKGNSVAPNVQQVPSNGDSQFGILVADLNQPGVSQNLQSLGISYALRIAGDVNDTRALAAPLVPLTNGNPHVLRPDLLQKAYTFQLGSLMPLNPRS